MLIRRLFNKIISNKNIKSLIYYILVTIGGLSLSWLMYIRFIRERLPRNIPFNLTELWFYILLGICFVYIYAIKNIIKPKAPNQIILNIIKYFATANILFDELLKTNKYTIKYRKQWSTFLLWPYSYRHAQLSLALLLSIIPRLILSSIFLFDVLYYNHIENFYYFLFLGILPLLYNYHRFCMYQARDYNLLVLEQFYHRVDILEEGWAEVIVDYEYEKDEYGEEVEIRVEQEWKQHPRNRYHNKVVKLREYIQILFEKAIDDAENDYDNDYSYDASAFAHSHIYEQYERINNKTKLETDDYKIINTEFRQTVPSIIDLSFHLHYIPIKEKKYHIHTINAIIFSLFLLGWGYILIKSFHTLKDIPVTLKFLTSMTLYTEIINPFINP